MQPSPACCHLLPFGSKFSPEPCSETSSLCVLLVWDHHIYKYKLTEGQLTARYGDIDDWHVNPKELGDTEYCPNIFYLSTSENLPCWWLQYERWRKLKQQETMLLSPVKCPLSAPSQTPCRITLRNLSQTHLIQRPPMPHVVQRSWKWRACKVMWII